MTSTIVERKIAGAKIDRLSAAQATDWLDWLIGRGPPPAQAYGVCFALAHTDSGVTWGYLVQAAWKLGSSVDPGLCPIPTASSLHELRLFGNAAEVLIWRGDNGLQGRILADDGTDFGPLDPLRPMDEARRLQGEGQKSRDGFVPYIDAGGARHLAPESFPGEFSVRYYFEQDSSTGAVRIAATRLIPENVI